MRSFWQNDVSIKRLKSILLLGLFLYLSCHPFPSWGKTEITPLNDIIKLEPNAEPKAPKLDPRIHLSKPVKVLESSVQHVNVQPPANNANELSTEDSQNLKALWQTVVAHNPIIQFGLKQLATPPELRYAHESIMLRTLSGLLSSAGMVPYMMGAGQITAGAAAVGANLTDRALQQTKKVDPAKLPSDTELVELSGIIQSLQKSLVENYFSYKNGLSAFLQLEQLKQQTLGSLKESLPKSTIELVLRQQLLEDLDNQITSQRNQVKCSYLVLERLVGKEAIHGLHFSGPAISVQETPKAKS